MIFHPTEMIFVAGFFTVVGGFVGFMAGFSWGKDEVQKEAVCQKAGTYEADGSFVWFEEEKR